MECEIMWVCFPIERKFKCSFFTCILSGKTVIGTQAGFRHGQIGNFVHEYYYVEGYLLTMDNPIK